MGCKGWRTLGNHLSRHTSAVSRGHLMPMYGGMSPLFIGVVWSHYIHVYIHYILALPCADVCAWVHVNMLQCHHWLEHVCTWYIPISCMVRI